MDPHLVFDESSENIKTDSVLHEPSEDIKTDRTLLLSAAFGEQTPLGTTKDGTLSASVFPLTNSRLSNTKDSLSWVTVQNNATDLQYTNRFYWIGKKLQHLLDGYLWLILQVIAFTISHSYIKEAYGTWQDSPVVVSVNNTQTHVRDIPFPAVTICALPTLNERYNFKRQVSKCFECNGTYYADNCNVSTKCTLSELAAMSIAFLLCGETVHNYINVYDHHWDTLLHNLVDKISLRGGFRFYSKEILPECNVDIKQGFLPCNLWQTLLMGFTDSSVCFDFNSLKIQDLYEDQVAPAALDDRREDYKSKVISRKHLWTTDNMMDFAEKEDSIPFYGGGQLKGLKFRRLENQNFLSCSGGIEVNPRIGFHHPGEVPMVENTNFYSFLLNKNIIINVTPKMMTAHKNLVDYEPAKRMCFFSHEHKLSMFKFYTQKNCQIECRANCTLTKCGCVPYFLPRQNESVELCTIKGLGCSIGIEDKTLEYRVGTGEHLSPCRCNCLPDCNSLSYEYKVEEHDKPNFKNYSKIRIQYKDVEFSTMVRYGVSSWAEFVAYSLGILGVFNGLCGVGMCETIYSRGRLLMRRCINTWPKTPPPNNTVDDVS